MNHDLRELLEDMLAKGIISQEATDAICDFYHEIYIAGNDDIPPAIREWPNGKKPGNWTYDYYLYGDSTPRSIRITSNTGFMVVDGKWLRYADKAGNSITSIRISSIVYIKRTDKGQA